MKLKSCSYLFFPIFLMLITILENGYLHAEDTPQKTELREMDFAYGRRILLGSDSPIYRFYLDEHIYRNVADKRLVDLRIFNNQKETVPLKIRRGRRSTSMRYKELKLPIFPIHSQQDLASGDFILKYKRGGRETMLSLESAGSQDSVRGISGFIIDLGESEKPPKRLRFKLNPSGGAQFRLAVKVSVSDDLTDWKVLVPSTAVVKMRFDGHDLEKKYINLPSFSGRYLYLSWDKPFEGDFSAEILGQYAAYYQPPPRRLKLKGEKSDSNTNHFTYDTGGVVPVNQIQLHLPGINTLVKARISTRWRNRDEWNYQKTAIFYRLKIDGTELENPPVTIPVTQAPQFKIDILAGSGGHRRPAPELVLFYNPHECVFVASGDPPFMLAYGNADLLSEPQVVDDLLEAIGQQNKKTYMGFSRLDSPLLLGGGDRLKSSKKSKEHWLRVVLWAILLLSVVGLALMAYQLHRQMKT